MASDEVITNLRLELANIAIAIRACADEPMSNRMRIAKDVLARMCTLTPSWDDAGVERTAARAVKMTDALIAELERTETDGD